MKSQQQKSKESIRKAKPISPDANMHRRVFSNDIIKNPPPIMDTNPNHTSSKEYIDNIKMIWKQEEEKSRMINRFLPRPSFAKWFKTNQIVSKNNDDTQK